jgi:periplasmic protein TonB
MKVPGERLLHPLPAGLRDSVGAAVLLSTVVHVGAIAWGVSGTAERTMVVDSGAATVIEVALVEGPADGAAGDNAATPSRPEAVPTPAAEPAPKAPPTEDAADRAVSADRVPQPATASDVTLTSALPPDPHAAPVPPPKPSPPLDAAAETPGTARPMTLLSDAPQLAALPSAGQPTVDSTPGTAGRGTEGAAPQADNPAPAYPFAARRRGQEGRVVLSVEVLPSGDAGAISVARSSGVASLDRAATDAVRRWRFRPARRDGRPVRATVRVPVRFALE